jgi:hypothetical protein
MVTAGCTAGASPQAVIEIGERDGPLWLRPDEIRYYGCEVGVLFCDGGAGRRSERLCRCIE